jgi:Tc5 transposase DNA-binding domain
MEAAIAHLDAQDQPNYAAAARLYGLAPSTLARRHQGISVSRAEATSTHHQRLNNVQKDTLLGYIDALTDLHMPPTTQIIKDLVEEIVRGKLGQNWTARFIKRHSQRIYSLYLRALN